jgi:hypothetical protein
VFRSSRLRGGLRPPLRRRVEPSGGCCVGVHLRTRFPPTASSDSEFLSWPLHGVTNYLQKRMHRPNIWAKIHALPHQTAPCQRSSSRPGTAQDMQHLRSTLPCSPPSHASSVQIAQKHQNVELLRGNLWCGSFCVVPCSPPIFIPWEQLTLLTS